MGIYERFFDEFAHAGEISMPVDGLFLMTPAFAELSDRLHVAVSSERHRDSWRGLGPT